MDKSALCPPNNQWLSDGVIGDVLQRSGLRRSAFQSSAAPPHRPPLPHLHAVARLDESNDNSGATKGTAAPAPLLKLAKATKSTKGSCGSNQGVDEVERRRQRNREHQARHKKKQRTLVTDLEESVQHLKEEIQELELKKQLVAYGIPTSNNVWGIAAEFFRLFRNSVNNSGVAVGTGALYRPKYHVQRDFLLATMTSDVTDGDVYGVDALMENWAMQSQCYQEIDLQPVRLENGPGDAILATTRGTLVINENTVRYSFPHLAVGNEERWPTLAEKMVGQTLKLRGSAEFEWDEASGRVKCVRCKADILTPLLRLLGSLDDVSHVFHKARLTPDGRLV